MSIPPDSGGKKPRSYSSPPPDWLKADKSGQEIRPAATPDWLDTQPPGRAAPPGNAPDWLAKIADEPAASPPRPIEPASNSSLTALRPPPDDDLFASLRADTAKPPVAGTPDWMSPNEPAAEEIDIPDFLTTLPPEEETKAAKPAAPAEDLSWMTPSSASDEAKPAEDAPDWMSSLSPTDEAKPADDAPDWMSSLSPTDEAKPADDAPDWMSSLSPTDEAKPADDAPDWMSSLSPTDEAKPADDAPDWMSSLSPTDEAKPADDAPDWMSSLSPTEEARPAEGATLDWLPSTDADKPAEASAAASEEVSELPDWLTAPDAPAAADKPAKEPGKSGMLKFLGNTGGLDKDALPPAKEETPQAEVKPTSGNLSGSPDWLDALEKDNAALTSPNETPDWLGQMPAAGPADPSSLTLPPAAPTKTPDWLEALAHEEGSATPAPDSVSPADAPDWLDQVMKDDAPAAAPAETADWLDAIGKPSAEPQAPAESSDLLGLTPEDKTESDEPAPAETPDWLNQIADGEARPAEALTPAPASPAETADWLNQIADGGAGPAEASTPAPASPAETPDWLNQMAETEAKPAEVSTTAPAETPDWLNQIADGEAKPSEKSTPTPASPAETPDWLNQLAETEAKPAEAPTPGPAASAETQEPAGSGALLPGLESLEIPGALEAAEAPAPTGSSSADMADLLSDMDLGMPSGPIDTSEDLLGMSGDLGPTPQQKSEPGEAEPGGPEELPEWLRTMQAAPEPKSTPAEEESLSADSLGDMDDLRFDKLVGKGDAPPQPDVAEKIGALKDVIGPIQPELIFDAQTLKPGKMAAEMTVTREQSQRIQLLEDLLTHKTEEVVISGPRRSALPLMRWAIALLIIAAAAAPAVMGFSLLSEPGSASAGPTDAKNMLGNLSSESRIVVAFDYEPDTSGELDPLALAILGEIATQTDASVYAVSTRTTGPALAQHAFEKTLTGAEQQQKDRWLNLGYIPGGANGITTLVIGSPAGLPSALSINALGQPSGLSETSLTELKPTLIVVLTANADDLRAWVEQAGRPMGTPMLAATSAGNMPMAAPYRQSRQVSALMSGVNDAVTFRSLTGQPADAATNLTWNMQGTGALIAALIIIAGGVYFGLTALREQWEQGS